jgi:hypothetical protein
MKYIRVKWSVVCRPKDQAGLGIHDLEVKNKTPCKWLFKFLSKDGIWENILKQKYVASKALSQVT